MSTTKDRVQKLKRKNLVNTEFYIVEDTTKAPRSSAGYQLYCNNCGFELEENACCKPICPDCGSKLRVVRWKKGDRR